MNVQIVNKNGNFETLIILTEDILRKYNYCQLTLTEQL
jgi:hypothetical protein